MTSSASSRRAMSSSHRWHRCRRPSLRAWQAVTRRAAPALLLEVQAAHPFLKQELLAVKSSHGSLTSLQPSSCSGQRVTSRSTPWCCACLTCGKPWGREFCSKWESANLQVQPGRCCCFWPLLQRQWHGRG
ncbi:unnamed protein product [Polarella glacialis]|uniref:Uncharacterized protein n=1 Tax=Polarella glacialis TaxID=89957 RepID=A0A813F8J4_POLGL|nr:unnamed protein product [Polarella glacialis]